MNQPYEYGKLPRNIGHFDGDFRRVMVRRLEWLKACRKNFGTSPITSLEHVLELVELSPNGTFVTLYDMINQRFVTDDRLTDRLMECTGYTFDEFTILTTNNHDDGTGKCVKLVHEDDMRHIIRYDDIVYRMVLHSDLAIASLKDRYSCAHRMWAKNGDLLSIERDSYLVQADLTSEDAERRSMVRVDTWQVLAHRPLHHVEVSFRTGHCAEERERLAEMFYHMNLEALGTRVMEEQTGLDLTYRQLAVLDCIERGANRAETAYVVGILEPTVSDRTRDLRNAVREVLLRINPHMRRMTAEGKIDTAGKLVAVCRQYGLLPCPMSLIARGMRREAA